MPSQQVLQRKIREGQEVLELLQRYPTIGIASLQKVRAAQLQKFKKNLAGRVLMRVVKNTAITRAIESCKGKPGLKKLAESIEGANIYLFTRMNPFKLALLLQKGRMMMMARSGDTAAIDVVVPAGNTGQPPGPVISELNAVGLPTRIESGSVWITKDTLVVKRGEAISERLANILSRLGMKSVEAGLVMKLSYDDGLIVTGDQLQMDLEETKKDVKVAFADAFALSLSAAYPTGENITMLIQVASQEAYSLGINASIPTKQTIEDLIQKANAEMVSLSSRLPVLEEESERPVETLEEDQNHE